MKNIRIFSKILVSGILAQAIIFLGNIVFSRIYSPEEFGRLAYYTGVASIVAVISGFRFDYVAFSRKINVRPVFFAVALINALFINIIFWFFLIAVHLSTHGSINKVNWTLVFCFSGSLWYLGTQWLISQNRYNEFSSVRIVQAISQVFLGLVFIAIPTGGLLASYSISQILCGIYISIKHKSLIFNYSLSLIFKFYKKYFKYCIKNTVLTLLQYSTPFAPILIGGYFFTPEQTGTYFLFSTSAAATLAVFRRTVLNFFLGELNSIEKFNKFFFDFVQEHKKTLIISVLLITFFGVFLWHFSSLIVSKVFGNAWIAHENLLFPVIGFFLVDALLQPFTVFLPLWGRVKYSIIFESIRFALVYLILPVLILLFKFYFFTAILTYFTFMIASYLLNFYYVFYFSRKFCSSS